LGLGFIGSAIAYFIHTDFSLRFNEFAWLTYFLTAIAVAISFYGIKRMVKVKKFQIMLKNQDRWVVQKQWF